MCACFGVTCHLHFWHSASHHTEAPTTLAQSVPQLYWLQEGVWQNLACRPVAGPQKLQHRWRTNLSHSGTIWELQQCCTLEQAAGGVLQDNSSNPSGMTLTVQYNTIQYNFIAKWQMHKKCVMVPSTYTHTHTSHTKKPKPITVNTLKECKESI